MFLQEIKPRGKLPLVTGRTGPGVTETAQPQDLWYLDAHRDGLHPTSLPREVGPTV